MAFKLALVEAVLEELGEEMLVLRQRDHAVADVAGGKDVELVAKSPGGTAIVGDGDHGGELADRMLPRVSRRQGCGYPDGTAAILDGNVLLEAAQKRREAVDLLVRLAWRGIAELTP